MKLHLSLKFLIVLSLGLCAVVASAQTQEDPPLVEVELIQDNLAPYIERRDNSGIYFGINYEGVDLKNYISVLDGVNQSYASIFGSNPVPLIRVNVDYKYNTSVGSIAAGIDVGTGNLSGTVSGVTHDLTLLKYGVGLKWTLDSLWAEPYVAPYLGINFWQMGIKEKTPTDSFDMTTDFGYNYSLGFLFQLDWLDYNSSKTSTWDWGIENTFLDVYATQYAKTMSDTDPNTETDFLYGAGLRLEF